MRLKFKGFVLTIAWSTRGSKFLKNKSFDKKYKLVRGYMRGHVDTAKRINTRNDKKVQKYDKNQT